MSELRTPQATEQDFLSRFPEAKRVLVVGGGAAGSLATLHLALQAKTPMLITMINYNYPANLGVAYSTQCVKHLLNVPCGKMSLFHDQPSHLFNWLKDRSDISEWGIEGFTEKTFIPRGLYGHYIKENLNQALQSNSKVALCEVEAEATQLKKNMLSNGDEVWSIQTSAGEFKAESILFALGNFAPAIIEGIEPPVVEHANFFRDPWKCKDLSALQKDDRVLVLGTGLTMVDMVMKLRQDGFQGKIVGFSRRGLLPMPHQMNDSVSQVEKKWPDPETSKIQLNSLFAQFRAYLKEEEANGGTYRSVIDSLRPYTAKYWQKFSDKDKSRFMRHLRALWDVHRHRKAENISEFVQEQQDQGNLELVYGALSSLAVNQGEFKLSYRPRGSKKQKTYPGSFAAVINCTGPSGNLKKVDSSLCHSVFDHKAAKQGPLKMGWVVDDGFRLLADSQPVKPTKGLYSIGSCLKGQYWETLAIPELRVQSKLVAESMIHDLKI